MRGRVAAAVVAVGVLLSGCTTPGQVIQAGVNALIDAANPEWDPGNIISDAVFYNATAMRATDIQGFLDRQGCSGACLSNTPYSWPGATVDWCYPVAAGAGSFAVMLDTVSEACGINPQVSLVMIQKESQGLTRPPPSALTGFGCPDTGAGGSANCDGSAAGVWNQVWGMVQAFAHLRTDPSRINYPPGKTTNILWNVAETGCGSAPVTVANTATGTLYTYTPYQPNPASIASYPGEGDRCSSYGNRNFFRMFLKYFGPTGGGKAQPGGGGVNGTQVTLPNNEFVLDAAKGATITAPTPGMAKGLAAGISALGLPYVWGGGGDGAGPNNGCARGGGANNSCGSEIGFDCSGLTAYVLVQGGYPSPGGESGTQRAGGVSVPYEQGQPGDIVGFPGHVAIYLGVIAGSPYILEASWVGTPIHIVRLTRGDRDPVLHRYWTPASVA